MAGPWSQWLKSSLGRLQQHDLLRVLRPIIPTYGAASSPVKVRLACDDRASMAGHGLVTYQPAPFNACEGRSGSPPARDMRGSVALMRPSLPVR
jgi:hypothetical protein